jgi:hypothetical protein
LGGLGTPGGGGLTWEFGDGEGEVGPGQGGEGLAVGEGEGGRVEVEDEVGVVGKDLVSLGSTGHGWSGGGSFPMRCGTYVSASCSWAGTLS